jgi:DNA-binding LacI/PurR family transcriptional regulator
MVLNEDMLTDKDIDALFRSSPGGVIITSTIGEHAYTYKIIDMCKAQKIPLVVYGNHPAVSECDRVYTDHMRGSKEITEWLISKGCRKILPFFPLQPSKNWEKMRIQGYTEAMTAAGLEVRECAWHGIKDVPETPLDAEFNIGRALAFEKLSELQENNGFDAIMCQTDHFAKIVISALRQLGFIPNKDVLVAGYDNVMPDLTYDPFESEYSIVTIDKRNDKIANEMAKLLVERISGDLPDEPQCRTNSHELVVRDQSV